jgi:hypothetical protein
MDEKIMELDNTVALGIGEAQVKEADEILRKYKQGKANLEKRIVENEQWYKLRHWECMRKKEEQVQPTSAWLFNVIANKHADAMDNAPEPIFLPREESDKPEAENLSSIVPVILDQNDFESVYDEVMDYKLKNGTGVYGVFWDGSKLNGMGDISIHKVDLLSLFFEPGITDIQHSRHVFHVALTDNDLLEQRHPQLRGKLGQGTTTLAKYIYDDTVDTTEKSAVVDWYYHKEQNGKRVLHYCQYCNGVVLFATENEPEKYPNGWYDHGMYPFVFDPLFRTPGTPCGFGMIDVGKSAQEQIDRLNQAVIENALAAMKPRYFIRSDGAVNEEEFADWTKSFVHTNGNLGQDSIMPMQTTPLPGNYLQVLQNKIDELKETTGNRDISTGGTTSGVTAASAIAAMQEAGSKLSRDINKAAFRAFGKLSLMVVELIRQFYDMPRQFRILGENGAAKFVQYSNEGIKPVQQILAGEDLGYRVPQFDVVVEVQKRSPYSKMSQNELALQFYQLGFFNPQMADQALACLDMMDFDRKDSITQKIAQNGGMMYQMAQMQKQMLMLAQMVDEQRGSNLAEQIAAGVMGAPAPMAVDGKAETENVEALGGEAKEASNTKKARQRVAESTAPV